MEVGSVVVGLPDFDDGSADGAAGVVEDAAGDPEGSSGAGGDGVVDEDEVVVLIEREAVGVKGADGECGGADEFLSVGSFREPEGGGEGGAAEEMPSRECVCHIRLERASGQPVDGGRVKACKRLVKR
jgi:hypothetical protein